MTLSVDHKLSQIEELGHVIYIGTELADPRYRKHSYEVTDTGCSV